MVAKFILVTGMIGQAYGRGACADKEGSITCHSTTNLLHISAFTNGLNDLKQKVRASRYRSLTGRSQAEVAAKFNMYAAKHASVLRVVPCSDLTSSEVASLAQRLKLLTDDEIRLSLPEADGRQIYVHPEKASFFDTPALHDLQCIETMKLWAHHIPVSVKDDLSVSVILPTVPEINVTQWVAQEKHLNKTVSCVAGHTVVDMELEMEEQQDVTDWPHWPRNFHMRAKGYGPYPFWQFGPDLGKTETVTWPVNETLAELWDGADMEVWHSSPQRATKFYHSHCVWSNTGHHLPKGPCVSLQLGIWQTNIYTTEHRGHYYLFEANESTKGSKGGFCCDSSFAGTSQSLGTINRKFVDNMIYVGDVEFNGHFHNGRAKQYVMAMNDTFVEQDKLTPNMDKFAPALPLQVWYETDMEGKPLRFSEIGSDKRFLEDFKLVSSDFPYIYEEFDPTSFSTETISEDTFSIPEECLVEHLPTCRK